MAKKIIPTILNILPKTPFIGLCSARKIYAKPGPKIGKNNPVRTLIHNKFQITIPER
jgi:hypothetical protein